MFVREKVKDMDLVDMDMDVVDMDMVFRSILRGHRSSHSLNIWLSPNILGLVYHDNQYQHFPKNLIEFWLLRESFSFSLGTQEGVHE